MTESKREEFLGLFSEESADTLVAFCVVGGIFGEGIDLKKNQLVGTIIVGNGLPQIGTEREILQQYFQREEGAGFDYAFRYPGFNKILQAAGRVIRTEEDRGIVILLEDRLLDEEYRPLFPREWGNLKVCNSRQIGQLLEEFWDK